MNWIGCELVTGGVRMNDVQSFSETLADPVLRAVYAYWRGLCRSLGRLPRRREIDPVDLPAAVLPRAMILVREPSGRFRCDLAGTKLREMHNSRMAGVYLDEMMPSDPASVRYSIYARALGDPCAAYCRLRFAVPGREFVASDRLYLPALPNEGDQASVLFSGQAFLSVADLRDEKAENGLYRLTFDTPVL